jgi:hypothetical protein
MGAQPHRGAGRGFTMSAPRCNGYSTHKWGEEYDRSYGGNVQLIQACQRDGCRVTKHRSRWNSRWDSLQDTYQTWYREDCQHGLPVEKECGICKVAP